MSDLIEGIKLVGGLAGLTTFGFKVFEELKGYLKIKVKVNNTDKSYRVLTEIENTSKWSRKIIENAFLVISPENSDLIKVGVNIADKLNIKETISSTNDFEKLKGDKAIYFDNEFAFIPLDFYYNENIAIGDETLTYCCSIDETKLKKGNYSVRLYIYGEKRYHRSTQDLLTITAK